MYSVKLLLLDLNTGDKSGGDLRQMLTSSARLEVTYRPLACARGEGPLDTGALLGDVDRANPDLIFLTLPPELTRRDSLLILTLRERKASVPLVVAQEGNDPEAFIELLKMGVADYITSPPKAADVYPRIWRLANHLLEGTSVIQRLKEKLIGQSEAYLSEVRKIPTVAKCDVNVLILGETGTGKELCARAIHYLSPRMNKPFLPVNCGALPEQLIENELFGHERGAYTGAAISTAGLVGEADGGTLFLDEIDCLPLLAQVKILRFLQDKVYRPLGSTRKREADVRIVAATNTDLALAAKEGRFRQDLYFRLNVVSLALPALRDRQEDTLLLAQHFLVKYATKFNKPVLGLSADARHRLLHYYWPGNVRELEHVIERAVVFSDRPVIRASDLSLQGADPVSPPDSFQAAKSKIIEQFEKSYLQELLSTHQGNITRAAQAARKNRRAFWQLMRKYHLDTANFKTVGDKAASSRAATG